AHLEISDAFGGDERIQLFCHRTDEADAHAVHLFDPRGCQSGLTGLGEEHVRGDVLPVRALLYAVAQVFPPLVELVVAGGAHFEPCRVQRVDRGVVVIDERGEGGCTDKVTGCREHRVRVRLAHRLHSPGEYCGTGCCAISLDPTVEVVDRHDVDVDRRDLARD